MAQERTDWFFNSIAALKGDMFAYAFSITKSREDAEDAVHNAIIKAFDSLETLRSKVKFKQWMFAILRNECLLLIKQWRRSAELTEDIPAEMKDNEESMDLSIAVGRLSKELREVTVLYYKLGYSTREIALIVDAPQSTVMSRLARARELIRAYIEGEV